MERKLDWKPRFDPRSRNYAIADVVGEVPDKAKIWPKGSVLDQGWEGACVGFAWTAEALASPQADYVTDEAVGNSFASDVYKVAQTLDEWEGENYEGTSVLAGAKVMRALGFFQEYRWAFSIEDVRKAVIAEGPVVIGVDWYENMYDTEPSGLVKIGGRNVGGHALTVAGYHPRRRFNVNGRYEYHRAFQWRNSWGREYGIYGNGWIKYDDLAELLSHYGEACVPMNRKRIQINKSYGLDTPPLT